MGKTNYSDEQILEFTGRHSLFAVAMDKDRAKTSLPKQLKEKGTLTYALDIKKIKEQEKKPRKERSIWYI